MIRVVDELFVRLVVGTYFFETNVSGLRVVGRDDRAPSFERCLLKQREILTGFVDT